jgi:hypothetical protein
MNWKRRIKMVEIIALMIAAATLGILVWMAKGDAFGWTKKISH